MAWPRITLVTAVLNAGRYIEQTIQSVICQEYPNLEYLVVDGGSTDETLEIIRKYERYITWWVSEPDNGMYDALNKGFARSTGEIMGWISANDHLHMGALTAVGSVFRAFPEVEWMTGLRACSNEDGITIWVGKLNRWSQMRFLAGANRYIPQESTFWRRGLWDRAGGCVDASRRKESDFELWVRFFRHAQLYSVNCLLGAFRYHAGSVSLEDVADYARLCDEVVKAELDTLKWGRFLRVFRRVSTALGRYRWSKSFWDGLVMNRLYSRVGPDWPPFIEYSRDLGWVMIKGQN